MDLTQFITKYNFIIVLVLAVGFLIWKFIIQPIENENEPVPQTQED